MTERNLWQGDLAGAMALSVEAAWNQTEDDWRMILTRGRGRGRFDGSRLIASAAIISYGGSIGWICMVLVTASARRQGHATALMRWATGRLRDAGIVAGLDATPEGREVYRRLGFDDGWGITRLRADVVARGRHGAAPGIRPCRAQDLPAVARLDEAAFGADRAPMLAALFARRPEAAFVADGDASPAGFVLARDGRTASQIGPVVAGEPQVARALLDAALARCRGPVVVDVADHQAETVAWLTSIGFSGQRRFTRMYRDAKGPIGLAAQVVAVAGPELG